MMNITTSIRRLIGGLAVLGAFLWVLGCAPPPAKPPVPITPTPPGGAKLYGRINLQGNKLPATPVLITVSGRIIRSEPSGSYELMGLPEGKTQIVAELKDKKSRYLAVRTVFLNEGQDLQADLTLKDAADVDKFCLECHPYKGERTDPRQIVRDLHRSGFKPRKTMREPGMLDGRGFVTCESCHTIHQETGIEHFVHYSYKNGVLCNRCH